MRNRIEISVDTAPLNTSWYISSTIDAFLLQFLLNPADRADVRESISEAVQNCFQHAYGGGKVGAVTVTAVIEDDIVTATVTDNGIGIPDIERAMQPLFSTSDPETSAGLGFSIMQSYMDTVKVTSEAGKGTTVTMSKKCSVKRLDRGDIP